MSNIIPMVSSSPPPIDDGGGFGWDDDDDDFGTFASADDSFKTPAKSGDDESFMDSVPDNNMEEEHFADFEAFSGHTTHKTAPPIAKDLSVDKRPDTIPIVEDQVKEIGDVCVKLDDQNFGSTDRTLIDSGVYSSNISPVQQCDDTSEYKNCTDDTDGNITAEITTESVVDYISKSESVIDTNHSHKETCPTHSTIPNDTVDPQVVCLDGNESNEEDICENASIAEQNSSSSQSNIPTEDIPGNLESSVMNSDQDSADSVVKVIPSDSCARTNKESDSESVSLEIMSGNETANNDSEEPIFCQNQLQSDLSFDSDLKTQNTDQQTDSAHCVSGLMGPSGESADDACEISSSSINERLNGDNNTELNTNTENDNRTDDVNNSDAEYSVSKHSSTNSESAVDAKTTTRDVLKTVDSFDKVEPSNTEVITLKVDSHEIDELTEKAEVCETQDTQTSNLEEKMNINKSGCINDSLHKNENEPAEADDWDEFSEFNSQADTKTAFNDGTDENEDFQDFNNASSLTDTCDNNTGSSNSGNKDNEDDDFSDFSQNVKNDSTHVDETVDADENDDFGDFNANFDQNVSSVNDDDFGDFNATFETESEKTEEQSNDWAAFSEPQIVNNTDALDDDDDDEWSGFADDGAVTASEQVSYTTSVKADNDSIPPSELDHMSKHEKVIYAVTACFPALIMEVDINSIDDQSSLSAFSLISGESDVWSHVKSQRTSNALTYQWTKSQWNKQLFTTLHIDTRNILIGHKKTVVPVFASGLTLLEPTKGSTSLKPDVLVDTSKSDTTVPSQSQISTSAVLRPNKNDSIPAAQFDWSGSGLTNPLEANNKTLNLDFLIQDQATKSNALESEFVGTNDSPIHKPTIQPLENILANLKPSSTFKPTNQNEDYSKEASKVIQSLPDLSFMTTKVLMFPMKIDGL